MVNTQTAEPRLTIELVPRTCWGQNLRKILPKEQWNELREIRGAFSGQCSICGNGDFDNRPTIRLAEYPDDLSFAIPVFLHDNSSSEEPLPLDRIDPRKPVRSLHLHEVWNYDDKNNIQQLVDLQAVCSDCHEVKHFGQAMKVGLGEKALQHLRRVNNWDVATALNYAKQAMSVWEKRSEKAYELDVSLVNRLLHAPRLHWEWLHDPTRPNTDKYDSMQWAQRILGSNAVILDTETTGLLTSSHSEIIQIAVITVGGKILFEKLIKPRRRIPKRATEIHGVTNECVENCPGFGDIYSELSKVPSAKTVVAYNAKFDQGILAQTCSQNKLPMISCKWECAMLAYRDYADSGSYLPLPNSTHTALKDCMATLDIIKTMSMGGNV